MIKCVIWDLDNTIWDGVLSETGDVKLRDEIKHVLEFYNERGIVNSISSRNDFDAAMEKLEAFDIARYFILPQISWRPKSESVKTILKALHFRAENMLFIDDNPFERDEVKAGVPQIRVDDGSDLKGLLSMEGAQTGLTSLEAKERLKMYRLEEKRIQDREEFWGNETEFLRSCAIGVQLSFAMPEDLQRIKELVERTNQMNSTGIRYTLEEIENMMNSSRYTVYVAKVEDRYGSYGRSGLVIIEKELEKRRYEINLLIVSCRLMGKGIAQTLMHYAYSEALKENMAVLHCPFKRNRYNRQMILLYTMNGFRRIRTMEDCDMYELLLNRQAIALPEWIHLSEEPVNGGDGD